MTIIINISCKTNEFETKYATVSVTTVVRVIVRPVFMPSNNLSKTAPSFRFKIFVVRRMSVSIEYPISNNIAAIPEVDSWTPSKVKTAMVQTISENAAKTTAMLGITVLNTTNTTVAMNKNAKKIAIVICL